MSSLVYNWCQRKVKYFNHSIHINQGDQSSGGVARLSIVSSALVHLLSLIDLTKHYIDRIEWVLYKVENMICIISIDLYIFLLYKIIVEHALCVKVKTIINTLLHTFSWKVVVQRKINGVVFRSFFITLNHLKILLFFQCKNSTSINKILKNVYFWYIIWKKNHRC